MCSRWVIESEETKLVILKVFIVQQLQESRNLRPQERKTMLITTKLNSVRE